MKNHNLKTGSELLKTPAFLIALLASLILGAYLVANGGIMVIALLLAVPIIFVYLFYIIKNPAIGIITIVFLSFLIAGLQRYLPGTIKLGLSIDFMLVLTLLASFINIKLFLEKVKQVKTDLLLLSLLWLAYNILEIFNPNAIGISPWLFGIRSTVIYLIFIILLGSTWVSTFKYLKIFLYIWGVFTILGTLKGIMQLTMGLDPFEQKWLNDGNYLTHVLYGKLRVFSFFSDAGQFGAAQGQAAVVGLIVASGVKGWKQKSFFLLMGFAGLYGLMISGTRGAVAIPFVGAFTYVLLRKNIPLIIIISTLTMAGYFFLTKTHIGSQYYFIYRIRTAFDPEDASYQVRLGTWDKYKHYLKDKPFGAGVGTTGRIGQHFTPKSYLSTLSTDSFIAQIWVEQGIIGLILYLGILLYVLFKSFIIIFFRIKSKELHIILIALVAGLFGVIVASYGNSVIGQFPISILSYLSMVFLFNGEIIDKEIIDNEKKKLGAISNE